MERFALIGLGYVGLPVALGFARRYGNTIGFDIDASRVAELERGEDRTGECSRDEICKSGLCLTSDPSDLADATFFIVAVPTPVDSARRPDLSPLRAACSTVGKALKRGDVVVFESTVYPGVTEDLCGPWLCEASGLSREDFKLGYSPERINPGDKERRLESIVKVVSGEDADTVERVAAAYAGVVDAGVFRASSIKVAEAAKVIENTQRDLNIALMNELATIFDRMGICTSDVLEAAGTKWNFLKFTPGLVGGHCIGVDPYYLTAKAEQLGYHPEVILAGRRINDGMGGFVAQKMVKLLAGRGTVLKGAKVGVLGVTFKENVPDVRNSRVPDIVAELKSFGIDVLVHDSLAHPKAVRHEHDLCVSDWNEMHSLTGVVYAVPHDEYVNKGATLCDLVQPGGVFVDVKSAMDRTLVRPDIAYWRL